VFTGIIEGMGQVASIAPLAGVYRLAVDVGDLADGVSEGDSVALDGTCLTAVVVRPPRLEFDVVSETVERTAFASLRVGDRINVERSLRADGRFHGHFVQGHVDGTGRVTAKRREASGTRATFEVSPALSASMVEKGSVAVCGVSLTITSVDETSFSVALIPHTLKTTTLGQKEVGALVNVEVDVLGKYVRKLMTAQTATAPSQGALPNVLLPSRDALGLTFEDLRRAGFQQK
jgi:riboflavin synthase